MYPTLEETLVAHQMREEAALAAQGRGLRPRRLRSRRPARPALDQRP